MSCPIDNSYKIAVVIGNGPSLRGFDFKKDLRGFDTFGMNAAYRYWDAINWYPTYYSCLDLVVGLSHKDEIRRLIEKSEEYGIKNFLLRSDLIAELGAAGKHDKVVNFDKIRYTSPFFIGSNITTGSHTLAFAAHLGYNNIILLGIDSNYTEIIKEARQLDENPVLEIFQTPQSNPNYFFDAYQQKGDKYHIPNINPKEPTHINGWLDVQAALDALKINVINANLKSKLDCFPKASFDEAVKTLTHKNYRHTPSSCELKNKIVFNIVTPTLNAAEHLDETILSVISQAGDFSICYHIQDGGSIDGTIEKIKHWANNLVNDKSLVKCGEVSFSWDSQLDVGLHEAIQRGFEFLNVPDNGLMACLYAGELYLPHALNSVATCFKNLHEVDWLEAAQYVSPGVNEDSVSNVAYSGNELYPHPQCLVSLFLCDRQFWPELNRRTTFFKGRIWKAAGAAIDAAPRHAVGYTLWPRLARYAECVSLPHPVTVLKSKGHASKFLRSPVNDKDIGLFYEKVSIPRRYRLEKLQRLYFHFKKDMSQGKRIIFDGNGQPQLEAVSINVTSVFEDFAFKYGLKKEPEVSNAKQDNSAQAGNRQIRKTKSTWTPNWAQRLALSCYRVLNYPFSSPDNRRRCQLDPEDFFTKAKVRRNVLTRNLLNRLGPEIAVMPQKKTVWIPNLAQSLILTCCRALMYPFSSRSNRRRLKFSPEIFFAKAKSPRNIFIRQVLNRLGPEISAAPPGTSASSSPILACRGVSLADFDDDFLFNKERCPVCKSAYAVPVRYVAPSSRLKEKFLLRYCMDCQSFWCSPLAWGAKVSEENQSSTTALADWHILVRDRNTRWARQLYQGLSGHRAFGSVLEIGCGIGTALKVAADLGKRVCGYDVEEIPIDYGRKLYGIELHARHWDTETEKRTFDLVLCISTLEHFLDPLPLLEELILYCRMHGSALFISVPTVDRADWPHLLNKSNIYNAKNPFRLCDAHYTFFSSLGLEKILNAYGVTFARTSGSETGWGGYLCEVKKY